MTLAQREFEILTCIIEDYIQTAHPVSSRAVSKQSGLRLSPAGMRAVMADLCDKGYLEQPHTSAGRIPSAKAFRHYLDFGLKTRPPARTERLNIAGNLESAADDPEKLFAAASKLAAELCKQVGMVVVPFGEEARMKEIGFTLVKPGRVLAVLVLDGGMVRKRLVMTEPDLGSDELVALANYLNERFRGRTLAYARELLAAERDQARNELERLKRRAHDLAAAVVTRTEPPDFFVEGEVNLFEQVEFADLGRMRELMRLVRERDRLLDLFDKTADLSKPGVTLGRETGDERFADFGLVAARYGEAPDPLGVVAVVGPMRMDYARVLPTVGLIAQSLSALLKDRF